MQDMVTLGPQKKRYSEIRNENIDKAVKAGIIRPEKIKAPSGQILTYVLIEHHPFHHATLESASAEKYFLQAALGMRIRCLKVWNIGREAIKNDMRFLRGMLSETEHWDPAYEALDRLLISAGY